MTDVKLCRCGHSAESHLYPGPGPTMYGDCHECRCDLYNPPGGIKGVPIHPLFAFTEDEFRFVTCVNCERFRVLPDGVCEFCGWDNDNNGMVGMTRPDHPLHNLTRTKMDARTLISTNRKPLSPTTLPEIKSALEEYCAVVLSSDLSQASQGIYINHANFFVRWLCGEFDPGARNNPYPLRRKPNAVA